MHTNIHVPEGASYRTTTSSPSQARSSSSNTSYAELLGACFFAFLAARFSLMDFCAARFTFLSPPLSFALAIGRTSASRVASLWRLPTAYTPRCGGRHDRLDRLGGLGSRALRESTLPRSSRMVDPPPGVSSQRPCRIGRCGMAEHARQATPDRWFLAEI